MKQYATIFCLLAAFTASAADVNVPHTFTSGTSAKASEVNENFSILELGVNDNAARLDSMEGSAGSSAPPLIELEVVQVNATLGEMVDLGGEMAEIFEYIFRRFDTDEEFVLEYPSRASDIVLVAVQLVRNPPVGQVGSPHEANSYGFSINGFDARLSQSYQVSDQLVGSVPVVQNRNFIDSIMLLVGGETMLRLTYLDSNPLAASSTKSDIKMYMDRRLNYLPYLELRPKN